MIYSTVPTSLSHRKFQRSSKFKISSAGDGNSQNLNLVSTTKVQYSKFCHPRSSQFVKKCNQLTWTEVVAKTKPRAGVVDYTITES